MDITTDAASISAAAIRSSSCLGRSGGPVSEPVRLTQTRALLPGLVPELTGIQPWRG